MFRVAYSSSLNKSFRCQHTQGQGLPEVTSRPSSEVMFAALLRVAANIFPLPNRLLIFDIKCNLYILKRQNSNVLDFESICFHWQELKVTSGTCLRFKICFVKNSGLGLIWVNLCICAFCWIPLFGYLICHLFLLWRLLKQVRHSQNTRFFNNEIYVSSWEIEPWLPRIHSCLFLSPVTSSDLWLLAISGMCLQTEHNPGQTEDKEGRMSHC